MKPFAELVGFAAKTISVVISLRKAPLWAASPHCRKALSQSSSMVDWGDRLPTGSKLCRLRFPVRKVKNVNARETRRLWENHRRQRLDSISFNTNHNLLLNISSFIWYKGKAQMSTFLCAALCMPVTMRCEALVITFYLKASLEAKNSVPPARSSTATNSAVAGSIESLFFEGSAQVRRTKVLSCVCETKWVS